MTGKSIGYPGWLEVLDIAGRDGWSEIWSGDGKGQSPCRRPISGFAVDSHFRAHFPPSARSALENDGRRASNRIHHPCKRKSSAKHPAANPSRSSPSPIPAALSRQITKLNAGRLRTRLLVEAANAPTTKIADQMLEERGIPVVPDLLGNSGALIIAYFEWVQNRMGYNWTAEQVDERLTRRVLESYERARKAASLHKVGLRLATCMLGVERVAYFDQLRGIYA